MKPKPRRRPILPEVAVWPTPPTCLAGTVAASGRVAACWRPQPCAVHAPVVAVEVRP